MYVNCSRRRIHRHSRQASIALGGWLELAQRVVDALADLARDAQPSDGGIAPAAYRPVELDVGCALAIRVHGDFDRRPPKVRRAGLGELAAAARLARLVDDRVEPGQPRDLIAAAEAARLADLGEQVACEDRPDPVSTISSCVSSAAMIARSESTCNQLQRCRPAQLLWRQQPRLRAPPLVRQQPRQPARVRAGRSSRFAADQQRPRLQMLPESWIPAGGDPAAARPHATAQEVGRGPAPLGQRLHAFLLHGGCTGSTKRTSQPRAESSRQTQRHPSRRA